MNFKAGAQLVEPFSFSISCRSYEISRGREGTPPTGSLWKSSDCPYGRTE